MALNGDVSHDAIAMFAPAQRIFARETGLVLPGLLQPDPAPDPGAAVVPAALRHGADRAAATAAAQLSLYRAWMARALRQSPRARAEGIEAAAQGRALSARSAIDMGLIDDIGFAQDALDWVREQSAAPGSDTRLAVVHAED